jgi:hypothetical protein
MAEEAMRLGPEDEQRTKKEEEPKLLLSNLDRSETGKVRPSW